MENSARPVMPPSARGRIVCWIVRATSSSLSMASSFSRASWAACRSLRSRMNAQTIWRLWRCAGDTATSTGSGVPSRCMALSSRRCAVIPCGPASRCQVDVPTRGRPGSNSVSNPRPRISSASHPKVRVACRFHARMRPCASITTSGSSAVWNTAR